MDSELVVALHSISNSLETIVFVLWLIFWGKVIKTIF